MSDELPDNIRVPLDEVYADALYLFSRVQQGSMTPEQAAASVRDKLGRARRAIGERLMPGVNIAFQDEVRAWCLKCLGPQITMNKAQRSFRFLEEAVELVQATGMSEADINEVVRYVLARDVGEVPQEVAGSLVTLAALCNAHGIDLATEAMIELRRIQRPEMVERIRAKQASKPNAVGGQGQQTDADLMGPCPTAP